MKRLFSVLTALLFLSLPGWGQHYTSPTYFGMHAHGNQMPTVAFGSYRCWDSGCRWNAQNPYYGSYSFSFMGSLFDQAASKGATYMVYTFGHTPQWASTNKYGYCYGTELGSCYAPYLSDWKVFVQALARWSAQRKASGRHGIDLYELWNEPNSANFWQGSFAQMYQMAAAAYPLIHQYDPSAQVGTPCPQGQHSYNWLGNYFAIGGARYSDQVGFHGYSFSSMPESHLANIQSIRSLMAQYGISSRPLNDTEHYWWTMTGAARTQWIARHLVFNASEGISKDIWYAWSWGGSLSGTSNATVYAVVRKWLAGNYAWSPVTSGSTWIVRLTDTNGVLVGEIAWNTSGGTAIPTPASLNHYYDVYGNQHSNSSSTPVGLLPVFITY